MSKVPFKLKKRFQGPFHSCHICVKNRTWPVVCVLSKHTLSASWQRVVFTFSESISRGLYDCPFKGIRSRLSLL